MARGRTHKAVSAERDGFAALLGALERQIGRDAKAGRVPAEAAALMRRRVTTMVEQIGLGLHLTDGGAA